MIVFPNAKINIGLNVTEKRTDGYHNIETVFYPIKIYDALEIIEAKEFLFSISGMDLPRDESNLCVKAWHLLQQDFNLPPIKMHLHKNIPTGAGLGGGSADAAFAIKLLIEQFDINLSDNQLVEYCSRLGSDCAFFIQNQPVYAVGKGDEFTSIQLDLSQYHLVVIMPNVSVSTANAYASVQAAKPYNSLQMLLRTPVSEWKNTVKNDFERSVFKEFPIVSEIKKHLYQQGAIYASMSGSGAAVYGIFKNKPDLDALDGCKVFYGV